MTKLRPVASLLAQQRASPQTCVAVLPRALVQGGHSLLFRSLGGLGEGVKTAPRAVATRSSQLGPKKIQE
eukprot:9396454-Pyramimonas_sp.AAC.1